MMRILGVSAAAMLLSGCVAMDVQDIQVNTSPEVSHFPGVTKAGTDLPFSKAVRVDDVIYLSGELGIDPATNELASGGVGPETSMIFANIERTLAEFDADLSDVVKCSVFLDDMAAYGAMNAAYDAALPGPKPARSTFGVNGLALGAEVEIECLAVTP
ncbi:RidA family protein [Hyphomonas sp. UBA3601]|uniref:RidA family protein n=1 Tax=Hyphomonas sp. UBA3601 TaxID=1946626 RepID=UPI0025BB4A71|nr:RidA family protein [Hyphomonas sp. UBA3601]